MTFVSPRSLESVARLRLDVRMTALAHFLTPPHQAPRIHLRSRRRHSLPLIHLMTPLISVIFSPVTLTAPRTANSHPPLEAGHLPATQKRRETLKEMILGMPTGTDQKMVCKRYRWTKLMTALRKRNQGGILEEGTGAASVMTSNNQ